MIESRGSKVNGVYLPDDYSGDPGYRVYEIDPTSSEQIPSSYIWIPDESARPWRP